MQQNFFQDTSKSQYVAISDKHYLNITIQYYGHCNIFLRRRTDMCATHPPKVKGIHADILSLQIQAIHCETLLLI
jgi:hypothetical protein